MFRFFVSQAMPNEFADAFLQEVTRDRAALLAAILRFNAPDSASFVPDALPEEAAQLLRTGVLSRLEGSRAGKALVRAYLFRQSGLSGTSFFWDFREERRRLALLDQEVLTGLAGLYGGCLYASEAARCVRRDEVLALRAALGIHYDYVLSRGRFQLQRAREYFALLKFRQPLTLPERMRAAGFAALRLCMTDWPSPLRQMALLRLPVETRAAPDLPPCAAETLSVIWLDLKKLLLSEVAPQWQVCFA
jgi:hypothetical protein